MSETSLSSQQFSNWLGRTERRFDQITAWPLAGYAATLDYAEPPPEPGQAVPCGGHWLYFLTSTRQSELGPDGHARRGGFLPPVDLPRRMWAGGRLWFHDALRVGDRAERLSTIKKITLRQGRSGQLCFVLVEHRITTPRGLALVEEHDIVYREAPRPGTQAAADKPGESGKPLWQRIVVPDDVLLFRYSALTFNGHRIHYDRRYVTEVEGYPGLVVHGPLQASLLLDLVQRGRPGDRLRSFSFRALRPLFDTAPFSINGRLTSDNAAELWTAAADGAIAMTAAAGW